MSGKFGGAFVAGIVVLTLAATACGYDGAGTPTGAGIRGPGHGRRGARRIAGHHRKW